MNSILVLYFIFLLVMYINTSYITIPFKVQDFTWNDSEELIMKYIYKDILVKFIVGDPPQNVDLSACLGEYSTFIVSKNAEGYEGSTFNSNISQTYKALSSSEMFYFQTFSEAIKSKDDFTIESNNIKMNDLIFNLVTDVSRRNFYCTYCEELTQPGMVGFLLAQMKNFEENVQDSNFITQLKNKNLISTYDFFFDFENNSNGNIIIGKKPDEYYDEEKFLEKNFYIMKTSTISGDLDWSIKFDQIHYSQKKLNHIKPMRLRIEFGLITGYYEWEYMLENEFFSKFYEKKLCTKKNTNELGNYLHYFYCEKSVDLSEFQPFTFTINEVNYNFTLTKDDLFLDIGDKYLFLMTFGISELILGFPFIKKYQMVFNPNTKTIGFYLDKINEEKFSYLKKYFVVIIILSLILIGLLTVSITFFIKKKRNKNKKNATELLDDNFENSHKNNNKDNKIIDDNGIIN